MLTERADEILGQDITLVNVAADLADVALFALGLGLGLDVFVVVAVGHRFCVIDNARFGDRADEHSVGIKIDILLNLEGHKGVDISGQEHQAVVGTERLAICEFVHVSAALETEHLKYIEGRVS